MVVSAMVTLSFSTSTRADTQAALDAIHAAETAFHDKLFSVSEQQCEVALQTSDLPFEQKEEATLLLLDAQCQQKKYDDMLRTVKRARDLQSKSADPGIYWYWEGVALQGLNRTDALLELTRAFRHEFEGNPHFAQMRHLEAIAMARANRTADALQVYEQTARLEQPEEDRALLLLDWGQTLLDAGRTKEAESIFSNISQLSDSLPSVQESFFRLAQIDMLHTNWNQAVLHLDAVTNMPEVHPNLLAQALMALAESHEQLGDTNVITGLLQEAHDKATDPTLQRRATTQLGLSLVRLGNVDQGIHMVQTEIARDPADPFSQTSQLTLANILFAQGLYLQSLTEYQKYLDTYEANTADGLQALTGRGRSLTRLGRYPEAARSFERAYVLSTSSDQRAELLFMEADAYFANRQFDLARNTYQQVLVRFPGNPLCVKALFQSAECQTKGKTPKDAEATFAKLATDNPNTPLAEQALLRIAELRVDSGQWQDAITAYNTVMATHSNGMYYADALVGRGMAYYRLFMFDEAQADFGHVLELFPNSVAAEQAFYMRGICQYWLGNDEAAVTTCQNFLVRYPHSDWTEEALFWLAEHEFNQGNYAVAETNFLKFTASYPASDLADDALLHAGLSASRQREYVRCISTLSRMPTDYPTSSALPQARMAQADAMMELADFANAILLYDEVIRDAPDSTLVNTAWIRKGDSLFAMGPTSPGRYNEAIPVYQHVIESPLADMDLVLHGEYMIGRCYEALDRTEAALDQYYLKVVLRFLGDRDKGLLHDEASTVWFAKSVFRAADLLERANKITSAADVLNHLAKSGLPGAAEAAERANDLQKNHPIGAE